MKKLTLNLPLVFYFIIEVIANVLIFVLTPVEIRSTANFWLSWVFAVPVAFLATVLVAYYIQSDKNTRLIALSAVGPTCVIFTLLYTVMFFIAAYAMQENAVLVTVIVDIALSVLYFFIICGKLFSTQILREVNADQARAVAERKQTYIPELMGMLTSAISMADDNTAVKQQLQALSAQVAVSEKSSPAGVEIAESELKGLIYQINQLVAGKEYEALDDVIRRASVKLMERNSLCQTLGTR